MRTLSDFFVVVAAIASLAASVAGFSGGAWEGFWSATGLEDILQSLVWFFPASTILAFLTYLISRSVGLVFAWVIAIGSVITICVYTRQPGVSLNLFLFPLIQLIALFALCGDALMQKKIRQGLAAGNDAR